MMMLFAYFILAILIIAFAFLLSRPSSAGMHAERMKDCGVVLLDDSGLDLAQRIFDGGDYRWLHDEIGFPELALDLARQRKALALRWLCCLRSSFNELIRAPGPAGMPDGVEGDGAGWGITFQTIRFQVLLAYAMLVVWMFGPYTRIVPSFGWLRPLFSRDTHKEQDGLRART